MTKVIRRSIICYFLRIFRRICQKNNWAVKVFVIIPWSKVKFFTWLCLWVSHFVEHKFRRSFQDSLRPFCNCRTGELKSCFHCLLYCFNASYERLFHVNSFKRIGSFILSQTYSEISRIVLPGDINFNLSVNTISLNANIKYLTKTAIFEGCF